MVETNGISDLQLSVMRVLWDLGEATVSQVRELLPRELAPTTIATLLSRLEKRDLVTHRTAGRQFVYRAAVSDGEILSKDVQDLTRRWFRGDARLLVSHLLGAETIAEDELRSMKALIEAHERKGKRSER